jgi:hypothetical protein
MKVTIELVEELTAIGILFMQWVECFLVILKNRCTLAIEHLFFRITKKHSTHCMNNIPIAVNSSTNSIVTEENCYNMLYESND